MQQDDMKKAVAEAALAYLPSSGIIGIGTGSTVNYFIDALATIKHKIEGTVASSVASEQRLKAHGIPVFELNSVDRVAVYVDGADEVNEHGYLIKGLGGALTREKILTAAAEQFICIVDESKSVTLLGEKAPVPVEVIPMARGYVARKLIKMRANPVYRQGYVTDNGNIILDVYNLKLTDPMAVERSINAITGVVENGIFAVHTPQLVLIAGTSGVSTRRFNGKE